MAGGTLLNDTERFVQSSTSPRRRSRKARSRSRNRHQNDPPTSTVSSSPSSSKKTLTVQQDETRPQRQRRTGSTTSSSQNSSSFSAMVSGASVAHQYNSDQKEGGGEESLATATTKQRHPPPTTITTITAKNQKNQNNVSSPSSVMARLHNHHQPQQQKPPQQQQQRRPKQNDEEELREHRRVEIITRDDGTKFRRTYITRTKKKTKTKQDPKQPIAAKEEVEEETSRRKSRPKNDNHNNGNGNSNNANHHRKQVLVTPTTPKKGKNQIATNSATEQEQPPPQRPKSKSRNQVPKTTAAAAEAAAARATTTTKSKTQTTTKEEQMAMDMANQVNELRKSTSAIEQNIDWEELSNELHSSSTILQNPKDVAKLKHLDRQSSKYRSSILQSTTLNTVPTKTTTTTCGGGSSSRKKEEKQRDVGNDNDENDTNEMAIHMDHQLKELRQSTNRIEQNLNWEELSNELHSSTTLLQQPKDVAKLKKLDRQSSQYRSSILESTRTMMTALTATNLATTTTGSSRMEVVENDENDNTHSHRSGSRSRSSSSSSSLHDLSSPARRMKRQLERRHKDAKTRQSPITTAATKEELVASQMAKDVDELIQNSASSSTLHVKGPKDKVDGTTKRRSVSKRSSKQQQHQQQHGTNGVAVVSKPKPTAKDAVDKKPKATTTKDANSIVVVESETKSSTTATTPTTTTTAVSPPTRKQRQRQQRREQRKRQQQQQRQETKMKEELIASNMAEQVTELLNSSTTVINAENSVAVMDDTVKLDTTTTTTTTKEDENNSSNLYNQVVKNNNPNHKDVVAAEHDGTATSSLSATTTSSTPASTQKSKSKQPKQRNHSARGSGNNNNNNNDKPDISSSGDTKQEEWHSIAVPNMSSPTAGNANDTSTYAKVSDEAVAPITMNGTKPSETSAAQPKPEISIDDDANDFKPHQKQHEWHSVSVVDDRVDMGNTTTASNGDTISRLPAPSIAVEKESFASDAIGYGDVAVTMGTTLDHFVDLITDMLNEADAPHVNNSTHHEQQPSSHRRNEPEKEDLLEAEEQHRATTEWDKEDKEQREVQVVEPQEAITSSPTATISINKTDTTTPVAGSPRNDENDPELIPFQHMILTNTAVQNNSAEYDDQESLPQASEQLERTKVIDEPHDPIPAVMSDVDDDTSMGRPIQPIVMPPSAAMDNTATEYCQKEQPPQSMKGLPEMKPPSPIIADEATGPIHPDILTCAMTKSTRENQHNETLPLTPPNSPSQSSVHDDDENTGNPSLHQTILPSADFNRNEEDGCSKSSNSGSAAMRVTATVKQPVYTTPTNTAKPPEAASSPRKATDAAVSTSQGAAIDTEQTVVASAMSMSTAMTEKQVFSTSALNINEGHSTSEADIPQEAKQHSLPAANHADSPLVPSELSKQLRVFEAKNEAQAIEIDRLQRQFRILNDLQGGMPERDARRALEDACHKEAIGELEHQVASLQAQLAIDQHSSLANNESDVIPDRIASLELQVTKLEENEETQHGKICELYAQMHSAMLHTVQLEDQHDQQESEIDRLKKELAKAKTQNLNLLQEQFVAPTETKRKQDADADNLEVQQVSAITSDGSMQGKELQSLATRTSATANCQQPNETAPLGESGLSGASYAESSSLYDRADVRRIQAELESKHEEVVTGLSTTIRTLNLQKQGDQDNLVLVQQQLDGAHEKYQLRSDQFNARYTVQQDRIGDLEQQLVSLYAAYELLRDERDAEEETRQALRLRLKEADAEVARQVDADGDEDGKRLRPPRPVGGSRHSSLQGRKSFSSVTNSAPRRSTLTKDSSVSSSSRAAQHRPSTATANTNSSETGSYSSFPELILGGTLLVRGTFRSWKKKHALLSSVLTHYQLDFFDDDNDGGKPKRYGLQVGVSQVQPHSKHRFGFCVSVDARDQKAPVIYAAATTAIDYHKWMKALKTAVTGGITNSSNSNSNNNMPFRSSQASRANSFQPSSSIHVDQEESDLELALALSKEIA